MDLVDKFMLWLISIVTGAVVILLGWAIWQMCQGPWYGEGTVVDKSFDDSYSTVIIVGKVPVTQHIPACWRLKVVERNGNEHEGCVSSRVWDDAMLGHHINITEQYH